MKQSIALLALLVTLIPATVFSQTSKSPSPSQAILAFADDPLLLVITDAKGNPLVPNEGMVLPAGTVIKTQKTTAEIQLKPNGTIIKLAASTTFKIQSLRDANGSGSNDFAILTGKIRAVAAKLVGAGGAPGYNVSTPTANCGVRGTDFAMKYDADNKLDWVCVQDGLVDFTNSVTGTTVAVATSQFANTFDPVFQAGPVDSARLAQLFADLDFVKLNPLEVPGKAVSEAPAEAPSSEPAAKAEEAKTPAASPAASDPLYEFLKSFFGLEVGSVTIDGSTYSKAVLSPVIAFDKFKLGLYLPIVYTRDMFDANDWYRPAGNNEWSFGSDKSDAISTLGDFTTDLLLKIKYLEWGTQGVDPYYLKVGNLKSMALGHGSIVRNFANDQDFPAVRKIGLNAGAKLGGITVEGLADDLSRPAVIGGRLAFDTVGDQIVLGFQLMADLHLAYEPDLAGFGSLLNQASYWGDPILLVGGFDAQLFKLDMGDAFRTRGFADLNTLTIYNRNASTLGDGTVVTQGLNTSTLWHDGGLGSLGGETGVMGNLAVVDYRLSFQVERGLYHNAIFQGNYYRTRTIWLLTAVNYTTSSAKAIAADKLLTMGIFGSASFDLFGVLKLEAAYRYPLKMDDKGSVSFSDADDFFKLKLEVPKDKIPLVKLSGGVTYERQGFVKALYYQTNLFTALTVLKGEVVYGMVPGMDLAIGIGLAAVRDRAGDLILGSDSMPKVGPTISIDTRISL